MANLGLPVPPGFTITTEVCTFYYANDKRYPKELRAQVDKALAQVGRITGKTFGDTANPLLVSVRSGARASMPGMMDTVLNLGLNDETVEALAKKSGDRRFAYDSYRRFITMYSDVVLGVGHEHFEELLDHHKERQGYSLDTDLTADDWAELVERYKKRVKERARRAVPAGPARAAMGRDRRGVRLLDEPARHHLPPPAQSCPESWGTAVNVQAMVFGNMGDTSATGVAFTRNPSTGEKKLYGEFLINAQGEDVVAGIRTPQEISEAARKEAGSDKPSMEKTLPKAYAELTRIYNVLERHYRDMQDLEFTVEQGKLWMLQTRNGKRTAKAALRIAVELANEGLISKNEAVLRIEPLSLDQLLHPTIDPRAHRKHHRHRPAGLAGRRLRRDRVLLRRGGAAQGRRQEGHSGARRDLAGGHSRHARRRRHSHHPRRHDLARGRRRARHGQALRLRRGLAARRLRRRHHDRRRADVQKRRASSPSTARPARCWPARSR